MKTLAELKRRIQPETRITLVDSNLSHKYLNVERVVTHARSKSFAMATAEQVADGSDGSWLDYGKAADYTFYPDNPNRFTIEDSGIRMTYVIGGQ